MRRLAAVLAAGLACGAGLNGARSPTAEAGEPPGQITVEAGRHDRLDTPVSVALEGLADPSRPLRLAEVTPGRRLPVPSQVEPGSPPRLWWILSGRTPAGSRRQFEFSEGVPASGPAVEVRLDGAALEAHCRGKRVLRYNYGFVPPPRGVSGKYIRSGYIHPVWTPGGLVVTDDFPPDHHHHKGVWFPWTKTEFEGRHPDFWNLGKGTGTVRFAGFDSTASGPVFGGFWARHEHVDLSAPGRKTALSETWAVRVWNVGGPDRGYWLWDLTSRQRCASESPLRLPKYRYGGMGFRGSREWSGEKCSFLTSEGRTRKDGHGTRARWCDVAGRIRGRSAGVVVMGHPDNFRFPEPMRIHPKIPFFNFAPSQAGDWSIEPGREYVFRYRFYVHEGDLRREEAERLWTDFGEPPVVRMRAKGR